MTVDFQSCLDAGMTARDAAQACGVTLASARGWATQRGVSWRRHAHEAICDLPKGMEALPPLATLDLDVASCRALWASVLRDQWFWVFGGNTGADAVLNRSQAVSWFGTRDCGTICALAGIDHDYVLLRYKLALATGKTDASKHKSMAMKPRVSGRGVAS